MAAEFWRPKCRLGICLYCQSSRPFLAGLQPEESRVRAVSYDILERWSQWRRVCCKHGQWYLTGEADASSSLRGHKGSFAVTLADVMPWWSFTFTPSDHSLAVLHISVTACSLLRGLSYKDKLFQDIIKQCIATFSILSPFASAAESWKTWDVLWWRAVICIGLLKN